jgi:hypothetical protein
MNSAPPPAGGVDLSVLSRPPVFPLKLELQTITAKTELMIQVDGSVSGDAEGLDRYLTEVRQNTIPLEILLHLQRIAWQLKVQTVLAQMADILLQVRDEPEVANG